MSKIKHLKDEQITFALNHEYRQYLAGKLSLPQIHLDCIEDDIEIGISKYDYFTADKPHVHPIATEHGYVLEGSLKLLILDDKPIEYQFNKGDFFVLESNVKYASKNAPNSKILFIKSPGGNDKTLIEVDEQVLQWLSKWE